MIPFEGHLIKLKLYHLPKTILKTFFLLQYLFLCCPIKTFCFHFSDYVKRNLLTWLEKRKFRMRDDCDLWQIDSDSDLCWLEKISQPLTVFSYFFRRAYRVIIWNTFLSVRNSDKLCYVKVCRCFRKIYISHCIIENLNSANEFYQFSNFL